MSHLNLYVTSLVTTVVLAASSAATAQTAEGTAAQSDATPEGPWSGSLSIGANLNLTSNKDVVGQIDGYSALAGVGSSGSATYTNKPHEYRINGSLNESFSRTATLEEFVKNNDSLTVENVYNYYVLDWSGGFGRLGIGTSVFENQNVTADPATYEIEQNDGSQRTVSNVRRLRISDPFQPTSLNQSAGAFVEPTISKKLQVRTRFGLGARETFGNGVIVIDDDEETPVIEAQELADVYQAGFQAFAGASGKFPEQRFSYEFGVTGLLPILNNDPENRGPVELFRVGLNGALAFNAFDWLSANYTVEVTRDPQLIDKVQIQNNVFLTLKYDLISTPDQEGPTTEEQLEEARDQIQTLEGRIQQMEEGESDEESPEESEETPTEPGGTSPE